MTTREDEFCVVLVVEYTTASDPSLHTDEPTIYVSLNDYTLHQVKTKSKEQLCLELVQDFNEEMKVFYAPISAFSTKGF